MGVYAGRFILDFTSEVLNASEHTESMCVFDAGGLMTNDEFSFDVDNFETWG